MSDSPGPRPGNLLRGGRSADRGADGAGTAAGRRDQARTVRRRRRRQQQLTAAGTVAVVVAAAGGGIAYAQLRGPRDPYRVATVTRGSVIEQFASTGTVEAVKSATVSFPVSGTVAAIPVVVGQKVTSGQVIGRLDSTALAAVVTNAQQTLKTARQTLTTDEATQLATASATVGATTSGTADDAAYVTTSDSRADGTIAGENVSAFSTARPTTEPAGRPTSEPTTGPTTGPGDQSPAGSTTLTGLVAAARAAQTNLIAEQQTVDGYLSDARTAAAVCGTAATDPTPRGPAHPTATPTPTSPASGPASSPSGAASPTATLTASVTTRVPGGPSGTDVTTTTGANGAGNSTDVSTLTQCTTLLAAVDAQPSTAAIEATQSQLAAALTEALGQLTTAARSSGATATSTPVPDASGAGTSGFGPSGAARSGSGSRGAAGTTSPAPTAHPSRSSSGQGSSSGGGSSSHSSTGTPSTGAAAGSDSRPGAKTRTVTTQQLTADQRQLDADVAAVAAAKQNLTYAVLTTPLAGTVAAVSIASGTTVSAGSSSQTITVLTPGLDEVNTTVSLTDISRLAVGDPAAVTVDGDTATLTGTVSAIGLQNTASGGSTTFPVTVALTPTAAALFEGSGASVTITAQAVRGVLTVPTSAVHVTTSGSTVTVLTHGAPVVADVKVGAVGGTLTQIMSGLSVGEQVVLADADTPLPNTTSTAAGAVPGSGSGRTTRGYRAAGS
jgi:multidrug efflux pump subunit AcrA (membrane-fusion protein)